MYYGPLLGWAYVMGKKIKYIVEAKQVIPVDMTFAGENSDCHDVYRWSRGDQGSVQGLRPGS